MKTLHRLKSLILPSANTVGLSLLCVALFVAIMPLQIFGRGVDPSTQLYQDSKGSWIPAAYAHSHPAWFLIAASVLGSAGVLLLIFSAATGSRRRRRLRKPAAPPGGRPRLIVSRFVPGERPGTSTEP